MPIVHSEAVANAATDAVVDKIDLGGANPNGRMVFLTAGNVVIIPFDFSFPAFQTSAQGRAGSTSPPSGVAVAAGTVAKFAFRNRDDVDVFIGTVATAGGDIDVPFLDFNIGDAIDFLSLYYRAFNSYS